MEYGAEDINGVFPEAVYIKTRTQTFNIYHYYIIRDGRIWYKSIDPENEPKDWILFRKTGLPYNSLKLNFNSPEKIVEISADADELVAISDEGGFYRHCLDKIFSRRSNVWFDRQGWPEKEQLYFDRRTAKNRAWALGKRNAQVLYYEDPFGNQHHNGTMEIATTYVLLEDGQEICYSDTGLPTDFSRNYIGPERGAFRAVALSASASTMFVINEAGKMYTRLADFDTTGGDPMFFKYTYVPYKSNLPGTNYFSNLNEWGLPPEEWRLQPPVPLAGNAAITRHITILQNGRGNSARELRVAGLNESGETGYWSKAIFDEVWEFRPVPLYFGVDSVLETAKPSDTRAGPEAERGRSPDKYYSGYFWNGSEQENGWEYVIPNFNILEGDCDFRITWRGETCTLKLYPIEMWSYAKRDYLPGRTGPPKMFMVTLQIPENAFDGLSEDFGEQLARKYKKSDNRLFHYTIAASDHYIIMWETGATQSGLFLTDGVLSNQHPEFQRIYSIENLEMIRRFYSPELTVDRQAPVTYGELTQKIELNKTFYDELKYRVRTLKWSRFTAFKFTAGYMPLHYLITPLRFVEVPKIRTITSFGDKLILSNNSYIHAFAGIRIWAYQKLIDLMELRMLHYDKLAERFSGAESAAEPAPVAAARAESFFPAWYSEDIADYWEIAGLPRVISGTFFGSGSGRRRKSAVLSLRRPGTEPELFGWYFAAGETVSGATADESFSFFIDPRKNPEKIYSRGGESPAKKKLWLVCTLYVNPETNSPAGKEIIDRVIKPSDNDRYRGIKIQIGFDGQTIEIRRISDKSSFVMFRGQAAGEQSSPPQSAERRVPGYQSPPRTNELSAILTARAEGN
ncbi:MAG: hypothetical protein LBH35_08885 [Treponema sp.]|nr:hypothetical protein [Treponema sp.]